MWPSNFAHFLPVPQRGAQPKNHRSSSPFRSAAGDASDASDAPSLKSSSSITAAALHLTGREHPGGPGERPHQVPTGILPGFHYSKNSCGHMKCMRNLLENMKDFLFFHNVPHQQVSLGELPIIPTSLWWRPHQLAAVVTREANSQQTLVALNQDEASDWKRDMIQIFSVMIYWVYPLLLP